MTTRKKPHAAVACPGCGAAMQPEHFERSAGGELEIDICYACRAIWFDHMESAQLAPGGTIELFRKIHEHRGDGYHALPARMPCPRCHEALKLTNDIVKTGRVSYYRCGANHGRLTTFFHFLREKKFVRNLTPKELNTIKAKMAEVRCSGCGGPVDIQHDTACGYCRAPLSVLDAQAVEKALAELGERRAHGSDPAQVAAAMHQALMVEPWRARERERKAAGIRGDLSPEVTTDLVLGGISALVSVLLK
jgi:ssDNA-binding Zn-finger/Zn-ribbon topoisomerase 1